jgi:hypothetical protein
MAMYFIALAVMVAPAVMKVTVEDILLDQPPPDSNPQECHTDFHSCVGA